MNVFQGRDIPGVPRYDKLRESGGQEGVQPADDFRGIAGNAVDGFGSEIAVDADMIIFPFGLFQRAEDKAREGRFTKDKGLRSK